MGEFFKTWQRKFGVMTLLMTLVFTAGWVRSYVLFEKFCFRVERFSTSHQHLYSTNGQIWWSRLLEEQGGLHCNWHCSNKSSNVIICDPNEITWQWKVGEFEIGEHPDIGIGRVTYAIIPYWSIALPLAAVSAFLLLSNSGKSPSKELADPAPFAPIRQGEFPL